MKQARTKQEVISRRRPSRVVAPRLDADQLRIVCDYHDGLRESGSVISEATAPLAAAMQTMKDAPGKAGEGGGPHQ